MFKVDFLLLGLSLCMFWSFYVLRWFFVVWTKFFESIGRTATIRVGRPPTAFSFTRSFFYPNRTVQIALWAICMPFWSDIYVCMYVCKYDLVSVVMIIDEMCMSFWSDISKLKIPTMAAMLTASCGLTTLQPIPSILHTKLSSWPSTTAPLDLSHPVSAGLRSPSNRKMTVMKKNKKKDKDGLIWISNGTRWTASQWLDSRYVHLFFSPSFKH